MVLLDMLRTYHAQRSLQLSPYQKSGSRSILGWCKHNYREVLCLLLYALYDGVATGCVRSHSCNGISEILLRQILDRCPSVSSGEYHEWRMRPKCLLVILTVIDATATIPGQISIHYDGKDVSLQWPSKAQMPGEASPAGLLQ